MRRAQFPWREVVLTLATLFCAVGASADSEEFAIVVSARNESATADLALLRLLYLKELAEWPDGTPAKPIGRPEESREQQAFLREILKLEPWRLAEHWIALKQQNGKSKVRAITEDTQVAMLVRRYRGAFAVLPLKAAEGDTELRVLVRFR